MNLLSTVVLFSLLLYFRNPEGFLDSNCISLSQWVLKLNIVFFEFKISSLMTCRVLANLWFLSLHQIVHWIKCITSNWQSLEILSMCHVIIYLYFTFLCCVEFLINFQKFYGIITVSVLKLKWSNLSHSFPFCVGTCVATSFRISSPTVRLKHILLVIWLCHEAIFHS